MNKIPTILKNVKRKDVKHVEIHPFQKKIVSDRLEVNRTP